MDSGGRRLSAAAEGEVAQLKTGQMSDQATLLIMKPDAIRKGLIGATLSRLEALQLEIIGAKAVRVSRQLAREHYKFLREKPFFEELLDYLVGRLHGVNYVLAFVLWGPDAIERVRRMVGATHPEKADPASIRGALGRMTAAGVMENVVHASASPQEAQREIALWFRSSELLRQGTIPVREVRRR